MMEPPSPFFSPILPPQQNPFTTNPTQFRPTNLAILTQGAPDFIPITQPNNVQRAALQVMSQDDNFFELSSLLSSRQASNTYAEERVTLFQPKASKPLHAKLVEEFEKAKEKCYMGIFPEINRVWATLDNRLFLWDYIEEYGKTTSFSHHLSSSLAKKNTPSQQNSLLLFEALWSRFQKKIERSVLTSS